MTPSLLAGTPRTTGAGSGSSVGGVGLVVVLGMVVLLAGVGIMIWQRMTMPGFFLGETLRRGVSDAVRMPRSPFPSSRHLPQRAGPTLMTGARVSLFGRCRSRPARAEAPRSATP
ncbi:hypothetical protein GCM10023153_23020 [Ornithinibacter aureus]|uniref:Uncharacterized protein n=1 Tax=Ornithinibacter aureus TaxID=622664 RepID=A0ABP8JZ28_9MICO|nr:hypothetical protein C8E84_2152 [Ornithinibacter aureus]